MVKIKIFLLITLLFCAKCQEKKTEEKAEEGPNPIQDLTSENFFEIIKKYKFSLVEYYSPRCAHCKDVEPDYKALAQEFNVDNKTDNYLIARIDDAKYLKFNDQFKILRYPTILLFYEGQKVMQYEGKNEKDLWKKFLYDFNYNFTRTYSHASEIEYFIKSVGSVLIFNGKNEKDKKIFDEIKGHPKLIKLNIEGQEIIEKYNIKENTIVLLKSFDELKNEYIIDSNYSYENLNKFVSQSLIKIIDNPDDNIFLRGMVYKEPTCFLFLDYEIADKSINEKSIEIFREAVRLLKKDSDLDQEKVKDYIFTYADVNLDRAHHIFGATIVKMDEATTMSTPQITCNDFKKSNQYTFDKTREFTPESIEYYFKLFIKEKLYPNKKVAKVKEEEL